MVRPIRRSAAAALALSLLIGATGCLPPAVFHPRATEELRRGYAFVAEGDLERAEVAFSHALEFDRGLPESHGALGVVARRRGDLEGALRHYDDALALDDGFAEGHANRGEALLAAGDLDGAERALGAALALNPDLVEARHHLGLTLLRRGLAQPGDRHRCWSGAREAWLHVLEADGDRADVLAALALVDYLSGEVVRAEAGWARAAALAPDDAEAAHGLCISRAVLRRCREAIPECERCARLSPDDPRCAQSLAAARGCAGAP